MRPLFFALDIAKDRLSRLWFFFFSLYSFPFQRILSSYTVKIYHLEFCKTSFGIVHRLEFSKLNQHQDHEEIIWTLRTSRNSLLIDHRLSVSISCRYCSSNGLELLTHEFLQIKSKRYISVAPDLIPYCYMWNVLMLQLQDWIILLYSVIDQWYLLESP